MYIGLILLSLFSTSNDQLHTFTVSNSLSELDIVSLYLWDADDNTKGENWLDTPLEPDSSVVFHIPSGECNLLAFDELDNSYGVPNIIQKNSPDTLWIDLEHMTYSRPNVDFGPCMLGITNDIPGYAIDTLMVYSDRQDSVLILDEYRLFPGSKLILWLDKGYYSIMAVDQIGREFRTQYFMVPLDTVFTSLKRHMLKYSAEPIGIVGSGSCSLLLEHCLPDATLTQLTIAPQYEGEMIYLDDLEFEPGESIIASLPPGSYSVSAVDDYGDSFTAQFSIDDGEVRRLFLTYDLMEYDLGFPSERSGP